MNAKQWYQRQSTWGTRNAPTSTTMSRQRPLRSLSRAISRARALPFCSSSAAASFPLKNVTKSNFESSLQLLRDHVRAADFVAIDLEMTGVSSTPWRDSFHFDHSDVTYLKVKDSAEKFAVVQFGVCPFRWDSSKNSFIAHPYNFFVFPRQELPIDVPCYEFLCQTSSLYFLAKYQFDFNLCILEGVSYLSRAQEDAALRRLNLEYENESLGSQSNNNGATTMASILFTRRMKNRFNEWRDGLVHKGQESFQFSNSLVDSEQQFQTIAYKMRPAMVLNGFTSHQLTLIQLVITKDFKDLAYVRTKSTHSFFQHLVVYTDSEDDKTLLLKEVKADKYKEAKKGIQDAVGFRHVIDLLSSEKKLIIGHNCFLDITQVYNKFIGPLPTTIDEFSSSINKYFPHIIDTKILLSYNLGLKCLMKKSSTSLSSAFALLCSQNALGSESFKFSSKQCVKVEVQVDDLRSTNWNSGAKHEAGYDAFMTGSVFAQACSHVGIDFVHQPPSASLANNENLQKYINHIYLSWKNEDVIDVSGRRAAAVSLKSNTLRIRRSNIMFGNTVLIWGFPSKLNPSDIKSCIGKVFGPMSVSSVYLIDETAVFVQFSKAGLVSEFLRLIQKLEEGEEPISVSHPLKKLLDGGNTRATRYEFYKEICSSPLFEVLFADQAAKLVKQTEKESQQQESTESDPVEMTTEESNRESCKPILGQISG